MNTVTITVTDDEAACIIATLHGASKIYKDIEEFKECELLAKKVLAQVVPQMID